MRRCSRFGGCRVSGNGSSASGVTGCLRSAKERRGGGGGGRGGGAACVGLPQQAFHPSQLLRPAGLGGALQGSLIADGVSGVDGPSSVVAWHVLVTLHSTKQKCSMGRSIAGEPPLGSLDELRLYQRHHAARGIGADQPPRRRLGAGEGSQVVIAEVHPRPRPEAEGGQEPGGREEHGAKDG